MKNYTSLKEFLTDVETVLLQLRDMPEIEHQSVEDSYRQIQSLMQDYSSQTLLCLRVTYDNYGTESRVRHVYITENVIHDYSALEDDYVGYEKFKKDYHLTMDYKDDEMLRKIAYHVFADISEIKSIVPCVQMSFKYESLNLKAYVDNTNVDSDWGDSSTEAELLTENNRPSEVIIKDDTPPVLSYSEFLNFLMNQHNQ